ncbi:MAG: hypothetical protein RMK00_07705 [Bacteroidota bacterium]|nr:hypothetical protein [Bacteroidota bacterium]
MARLRFSRRMNGKRSSTILLHPTRRDVLGLAAASIVSVPAGLEILARSSSARLTIEQTTDGIRCAVGNDAWEIRPSLFGGKPRLSFEQSSSATTIILRNATFPGTDLPADFVCRIAHQRSRNVAQLDFAFGPSFQFVLEEWLAGQHCSRIITALDRTIHYGEHVTLVLEGSFLCRFLPDWAFELISQGGSIQLVTEELRASTNALRGALLSRTDDSMITQAPRRGSRWFFTPDRCTVNLRRGEQYWRLQTEDIPIAEIELEARQATSGTIHCALRAVGTEHSTLTVVPSASQPDIALALRSPSFALYYSPAHREYYVRAFHDQPRWIHTDIGSIEIGGADHAKPFELHCVDGAVAYLCCEPALLRTRLQVQGAIVEPALPPETTTIAFAVPQTSDPKSASQKIRTTAATNKPVLTIENKVVAQLGSKFSIVVLRPEDLLHLRFDFVNINLSGNTLTIGANALIAVTFPPQSIAERAYYETAPGETSPGTTETPGLPPVPARLSGESRLVFRVPQSLGTLPLTLDALLDWSKFELSVAPTAAPPSVDAALSIATNALLAFAAAKTPDKQPAGGSTAQQSQFQLSPTLSSKITSPVIKTAIVNNPSLLGLVGQSLLTRIAEIVASKQPPSEPRPEHTAIELPYRLFISPHVQSGWAHRRLLPPSKDEPIELWHTRLGVRTVDGKVDEYYAPLRTVRAIWSKDYRTPPPSANNMWPFRTTLTRNDRYQIVELSANFARAGYEPRPIEVERLMLTSLGGWLRSRGAWEPPAGLSVEEWTHRATLGRDHYVRVVYKGYLYPFGHRASLVKVTERKFARNRRGEMTAYLFQRMFIVVREPVKHYPANGLPGQRYQGRDFPFRTIALRTLVTPNLDDPTTTGIAGKGINAFWPRVGGKNIRFSIVATDWEGRTCEFTMPLVFIQQTINDYTNVSAITSAYNLNHTPERTIQLRGQHVAFAPPRQAGDTSFETESMVLNVTVPPPGTNGLDGSKNPWFYPWMEKASIRLQAVSELLGTNATTDVKLYGDGSKGYLDVGFGGANKGEVFLELLNPVDMNFSASTDKSGGLAAPNTKISAISRLCGPVGANSPFDDFVNGNFDPSKFFSQAFEAELIGSIKLREILQWIAFAAVGAKEIPKLVQQTVYQFAEDVSQLATDIESTYRQTIQTLEALPGAVSTALQTAINELKAAVQTAKTTAQNLWSTYGTFINNELGGVRTIPELLDKLKDRIDTTARQLRSALDQLEQHKRAIEHKINAVKSLVEAELKAVENLEQSAREKYNKWKEQIDKWRRGLDLSYEWKTDKVKSWPSSNPLFEVTTGNSDAEKNTLLSLKTSVTKQWNANPPTVEVEGKLTNFKLHLIAGLMEFLQIDVERVSLSSKNFEKVSVDPKIAGIQFKGPLSFVSKLQELIPSSLGDFLPKIDLLSNPSILVSWRIGLPSVTVGVFSIQNMALFLSLKVPFASEPLTLRFAFCERSAPFTLTVSIFGGGGFFALEVTPAGVQLLEAALEFGAQAALNLGIASGSVGVVAGIYYKLVKQNGGDVATLEGYLRIWGCVSVCGGIASASIVLYMSLTWQSNGKVYGQATLTIEVSVAFFSATFSTTVERQFKGSSGDPTFAQLYPSAALWKEYCEAFA